MKNTASERLSWQLKTSIKIIKGLNADDMCEGIIQEIDDKTSRMMSFLNLRGDESLDQIRASLEQKICAIDSELSKSLNYNNIFDELEKTVPTPGGLFLKHDIAVAMLEKFPPDRLLSVTRASSVKNLINQIGLVSVLASIRFAQSPEWMHDFFANAYASVGPDDFEERLVERIVLDSRLLEVAQQFTSHKLHNVSHLKEFGIIFIVPTPHERPGQTLLLVSMLMHYLHEVPYYSGLFRNFINQKDFPAAFASLLRGDVFSGPIPQNAWRIIQRYLAKDNPADPLLMEPHINPESDHWRQAQKDLARMIPDLNRWVGMDSIAIARAPNEILSLDIIDVLMTITNRKPQRYHQQEALWSAIFERMVGEKRAAELVRERILDGYIILP